jgi:hypothetical protein
MKNNQLFTSFGCQILDLVAKNIIIVTQNGGAPLTPSQINTFVAP